MKISAWFTLYSGSVVVQSFLRLFTVSIRGQEYIICEEVEGVGPLKRLFSNQSKFQSPAPSLPRVEELSLEHIDAKLCNALTELFPKIKVAVTKNHKLGFLNYRCGSCVSPSHSMCALIILETASKGREVKTLTVLYLQFISVALNHLLQPHQ